MQQLKQCNTRRNKQLFQLTVLDETKLRHIVLFGKTNIDYLKDKIILDDTRHSQINLNVRRSSTQPSSDA